MKTTASSAWSTWRTRFVKYNSLKREEYIMKYLSTRDRALRYESAAC